MRITKHKPDDKGLISIQYCIRLLTMGLQDNVPTLWAVTDPLMKKGIPMRFHVKSDDDGVTIADCRLYVTSFISNEGKGVFHLFGEEPKIASAPPPPAMRPGGPQQDPGGRILT